MDCFGSSHPGQPDFIPKGVKCFDRVGLIPVTVAKNLLLIYRWHLNFKVVKVIISEASLARVLLVEDEASLLELLSEVIRDSGHTVIKATNGQEALEKIEQEHPDLIISDVMMPVMNGYMLLHEINLRPEWHNIKTILVSAAPIDRTRKPPADAYVAKPYNLDLIENLIKKLFTSSNQP